MIKRKHEQSKDGVGEAWAVESMTKGKCRQPKHEQASTITQKQFDRENLALGLRGTKSRGSRSLWRGSVSFVAATR
eukprot:scaffold123854_cov16-Tisochrysis_lutea.AAC.1